MVPLQRPYLDSGAVRLLYIGKLAFDPRRSHRMTIVYFAFIRCYQNSCSSPQITGLMKFHQFCPVFHFSGGDARKLLHIHRMLRLVLQKRHKFDALSAAAAVCVVSIPPDADLYLVLQSLLTQRTDDMHSIASYSAQVLPSLAARTICARS